MDQIPFVVLSAAALFAGMLACLEGGRRLGAYRLRNDPEGMKHGNGSIESAIFALLGLLIAFTFSGAASRFDTRRELIVREANALGTAWLRLDLLPAEAQPGARDLMKQYLDARLREFQQHPESDAGKQEHAAAIVLQGKLWNAALAACTSLGSPAPTTLLLPALNDVIDITTTRAVAMESHPPTIVFVMLILLAFGSAVLAGHGMGAARTRSWLHLIGFAAATSITVFVILDLEYPRRGLIRINGWDQLLVDVRAGMK